MIPFCVLMALVMAFMLNPKAGSNYAPTRDYLITFSIIIYITGLLISFKREFWGSIVSLVWLLPATVYLLANHAGVGIIFIIVLFVPCVLFILLWIAHKEHMENPDQEI